MSQGQNAFDALMPAGEHSKHFKHFKHPGRFTRLHKIQPNCEGLEEDGDFVCGNGGSSEVLVNAVPVKAVASDKTPDVLTKLGEVTLPHLGQSSEPGDSQTSKGSTLVAVRLAKVTLPRLGAASEFAELQKQQRNMVRVPPHEQSSSSTTQAHPKLSPLEQTNTWRPKELCRTSCAACPICLSSMAEWRKASDRARSKHQNPSGGSCQSGTTSCVAVERPREFSPINEIPTEITDAQAVSSSALQGDAVSKAPDVDFGLTFPFGKRKWPRHKVKSKKLSLKSKALAKQFGIPEDVSLPDFKHTVFKAWQVIKQSSCSQPSANSNTLHDERKASGAAKESKDEGTAWDTKPGFHSTELSHSDSQERASHDAPTSIECNANEKAVIAAEVNFFDNKSEFQSTASMLSDSKDRVSFDVPARTGDTANKAAEEGSSDSRPEFQSEQNSAAIKLQSARRGQKARREVDERRRAARTYDTANKAAEGVSSDSKPEFQSEQNSAAIKLQSARRGQKARREVDKKRTAARTGDTDNKAAEGGSSDSRPEFQSEQNSAAIKLQSARRGQKARREVDEKRRAARTGDSEQNSAAIKLQSARRGQKARREVDERRRAERTGDTASKAEQGGSSDSRPEFQSEQNSAAIKLQSARRGQKARREVDKKRIAARTHANSKERASDNAEALHVAEGNATDSKPEVQRKNSTHSDAPVPNEFNTHESKNCKGVRKTADGAELDGADKRSEFTRSRVSYLTMKDQALEEQLSQSMDVPLVFFSIHERSLLQNYFEVHDADGSGTLNNSELRFVIDDMNRTPKEGSEDENKLNWLFSKADVDGSGELDFSEFLHLIELYYYSVYSRVFYSHDEDQSGSISVDELEAVSRDLEESGFLVDATEADKLLESVDQDGDGCLDFTEFCNLMEEYRRLEFKHLESTAGFSKTQVENIRSMFLRADEDHSGALDLREIVKLLEKSNLGTSLANSLILEEFVDIFSRMDKDRSATLDFQEFLRLLRVWDKKSGRSDWKTEDLCKAAREGSKKGEIDARMQEILRAKTSLIADYVENRVLVQQRSVSLEEMEALRENFVFSDTDGNGNIGKEELPSLLKNCGCEPSTRIQKESLASCLEELQVKSCKLEEEVVEEVSRELDFSDVVKLVVAYHDACVSAAKEQFGLQDCIPVDQLVLVFYQVGQYMTRAQVDHLLLDVGFDLGTSPGYIHEDVFKKMLEKRRIQRLYDWRSTYGFTEHKINRFKDVFEKHCMPEGSFVSLDVVPDLARVLEYESNGGALEKFTAGIEASHEHKVPWDKFLLLLKHLDNQKMKEKAKEAREVAKQIGLDNDALRQIRKLFEGYDEHEFGTVSKTNVRSLFSTIGVAKTQEQRKTLRLRIAEVPGELLDFVQFLRIVQDLNASGSF